MHPVWRVSVLNALDSVLFLPSPSIAVWSWSGHQLILIVIRSHPASICRSEHSGQSFYIARPESPSAPHRGWLHHGTEGPSHPRLPISLAPLLCDLVMLSSVDMPPAFVPSVSYSLALECLPALLCVTGVTSKRKFGPNLHPNTGPVLCARTASRVFLHPGPHTGSLSPLPHRES